MNYKEMLGMCFIFAGILILLFTFYEAYVLFKGFTNGSIVIPMNTNGNVSIQANNGTLDKAALDQLGQSIADSVIRAFPLNAYFGYVLSVFLLGIFASVGYKIAKLGIDLSNPEKRDADRKADG